MKKWLSVILSVVLSVAVLVTSILTAETKTVEAVTEPEEVVVASADENVTEQPAAEPVKSTSPWHFFNLDLQDNGDDMDDYNFGCAPDVSITPEAIDLAFRNRLAQDPALGAADMAWFDAILGTRYLGVFYDECNEEWDAAINKAKTTWINDQDAYDVAVNAFYKFLSSAVSVEIREEKGLEDQMYMNPFTTDGIPDVIVMETDDHEGTFLVYTFLIKGTTKKEVMYRIECGFQPTNVAEVMKITPRKRGGGGNDAINGGGKKPYNGGGPKPGPKPTPTPTPPPKPKPKKDPTQGTPVLPNDDPGPGENTNNPSDPNHSTKDQDSNSTNMTQKQYNQTIEEIKDANSGGGDTPSTPPPSSNTHQDSNAGEADKPTETSESSVSGEPAGGSWDGPPD